MANGFRCPSLIWPSELWRISARVMAGTLTITCRWINVWKYCNYCYNWFVFCL